MRKEDVRLLLRSTGPAGLRPQAAAKASIHAKRANMDARQRLDRRRSSHGA